MALQTVAFSEKHAYFVAGFSLTNDSRNRECSPCFQLSLVCSAHLSERAAGLLRAVERWCAF